MAAASSFDPSILILYFKVIVIFYPEAEVKILRAMGNKKRFGCFMFVGQRRKFVTKRHLLLFVLNSWMSLSPSCVLMVLFPCLLGAFSNYSSSVS